MRRYEVVGKGIDPKGTYGYGRKFGQVNFATLTDKEAEALVNAGFPHLQKKGKAAKAADTDEEE